MPTLILFLAAVAFFLSVPLTRVMIVLGRRLGQVDTPDATGSGGRKNHERPIPSTGGVAIFWAVALPVLAGLAAVWLMAPEGWTGRLAPIAEHAEGLRKQTPMALAVLGALAAIHVLGLIDDRKRLGPYVKLAVQVAAAAVLVICFDMRIFEFLGRRHLAGGGEEPVLWGRVVSVVLSVLWIIVITNAMNFLDNMDGLAGGVGAICAGLYLAATLLGGQWFVAAAAALLTGALLGFLVFNFPPAKVFMGDGGSLVVGLLLAIISIRTTYFESNAIFAPGAWYGVLMPLMVLAVPLYDFSSVTLIRLLRGRSPFVGDQNHFSHRLVKKGLSKRTAVIVIWLCTLATGLGGVMLGSLQGWQAALAAAQSATVLVVLAVLERGRISDL